MNNIDKKCPKCGSSSKFSHSVFEGFGSTPVYKCIYTECQVEWKYKRSDKIIVDNNDELDLVICKSMSDFKIIV